MKAGKDMWIRRLIWLALWVLSLVGISFYGGAVSYGLMCGILLIPAVSLCYLAVLFFRFKIYQSIDSRNVICGQPVPYYFVLQNDDKFSFAGVSVRMFSDFSTVENMKEDTEYELLPGESFRYDTKLTCKYRGEYEVGVRECVVTDFFRLFSFAYRVEGRIQAVVLPRVVKMSQLKSIGDINALLQKEVPLPPVNAGITVRDYVPGDPLKQVHWKATARERKLMVRERIGEEKQGISVLLDTRRYSEERENYLPLENKLLELTLALAFFFSEKRIPLSLYYGQSAAKREYIHSLEEFDAFYHRTPDIVFSKDEDMAGVAGQALGELTRERVVFFVVHEMREAYLELRQKLLASGTAVFFYVVSDQEPKDYLQMADCSGILYVVKTDAKLEEVL